MELRIEVHLNYQVQGDSDLQSLIEELIGFAKTQPEGATISTTYEGATLYIRAHSTVTEVYEHYCASRTRRLRPERIGYVHRV